MVVLEQMQQLLTAMQQQREQEQRALASVMETQQENRRLQQALAILAAEAKKAVNDANEQIRLGNKALKQVRGDAAEFAQHIAATEGVPSVQGDAEQ